MTNLARNMKVLGQSIVESARKQYDKETQDSVIAEATMILKLIDERDEWIEKSQRAKKFYEEKLDALQRGKFTITRNRIVFNDDRFNAANLSQ